MDPRALAILCLVAAGCVRSPPRAPDPGAEAAARRRLACAAGEQAPPLYTPSELPGASPPYGERIVAIHVEGQRAVPEALIREALRVTAGSPLDAAALAKDTRTLMALEVFDDVRIDAARRAEGLTLTYRVVERSFVGQVFVEGERPADAGTWFFPVPGDVYDDLAVRRAGLAIASRFVHIGHLDASARTHARRVDGRAVDLCLTLDPGPVYRVSKVAFTGNHTLSAADLRHAIAESVSERDRDQVNVEGGFYRADLIERARLFLASLAYERGLLRWESSEPEVKIARSSAAKGSVEITFPVEEGPVFHVSAVVISGKLAASRATYDALLDVRPGEVFSRARMIAVKERIEALHTRLGRTDLSVEPTTDLDADRVRVDFRVTGGR